MEGAILEAMPLLQLESQVQFNPHYILPLRQRVEVY